MPLLALNRNGLVGQRCSNRGQPLSMTTVVCVLGPAQTGVSLSAWLAWVVFWVPLKQGLAFPRD